MNFFNGLVMSSLNELNFLTLNISAYGAKTLDFIILLVSFHGGPGQLKGTYTWH
jgi:hypothetical protein